MIKEHLLKFYIRIGLTIFLLSICYLFFSEEGLKSSVLKVIFINIYYHLCYLTLTLFSKNSMVKRFSEEKVFRVFLRAILVIVLIFSILFALEKFISSIKTLSISEFVIGSSQVGLILGAFSLWISLNDERRLNKLDS